MIQAGHRIAYKPRRGYQPACAGAERVGEGLQRARNASGLAMQTGFSGPAGVSAAGHWQKGQAGAAEEPLDRCRVLLFRGRGAISTVVRWQTRSVYSHAALLLPDGRILESWQGSGVRIRELSDWSGIDRFRVAGITASQWGRAISFAEDQVGSGYDYISVLRFVSRRNAPENGRWFCSELVAAALQVAGVQLLARVDPAEVSPAMLSWSPLLIREVAS